MDISSFIESIQEVDWDKYSSIPYYRPNDVVKSLTSLVHVDKESDELIIKIKGTEPSYLMNAVITSNVLFAIGNNHRGTYYLPVKDALSFIIKVALEGNNVISRNCAISILIELFCFFPEPYSEELHKFVRNTIKAVIKNNKDNFLNFAKTNKKNKILIEEFFSLIED